MNFICFRIYREWKLKYDQEEDVEEDTITFTLQNTFIFNKTLSNGLTGNEEITVAHPLILVSKKKKLNKGITKNNVFRVSH